MTRSDTSFHVNQQAVTFDGDAQAMLLSVLRDELGLSGPKFGCGEGECGACTVLVDGQPQTACNLPVWAVAGKQVVTLEGLGAPECPHPLQTAFLEERAASAPALPTLDRRARVQGDDSLAHGRPAAREDRPAPVAVLQEQRQPLERPG